MGAFLTSYFLEMGPHFQSISQKWVCFLAWHYKGVSLIHISLFISQKWVSKNFISQKISRNFLEISQKWVLFSFQLSQKWVRLQKHGRHIPVSLYTQYPPRAITANYWHIRVISQKIQWKTSVGTTLINENFILAIKQAYL